WMFYDAALVDWDGNGVDQVVYASNLGGKVVSMAGALEAALTPTPSPNPPQSNNLVPSATYARFPDVLPASQTQHAPDLLFVHYRTSSTGSGVIAVRNSHHA